MNDAEILYNNVKNICREHGILIGKVETDAGVCAGYLERRDIRSVLSSGRLRNYICRLLERLLVGKNNDGCVEASS